MDDSVIIELLVTRNEKGLEAFYDKYAAALLGVINRIVGDVQIAEEVLSQSMLKVWNKIDTYKQSKSGLFTWSMAIARNSALDKKRLKSFENRKKTDDLTSTVNKVQSESPISTLVTDKLLRLVDDKYGDVLQKIYLEGYSQSETAELMDIPLGTVKTRLRKAIQILREELKDEKKLLYSIIIIITIITLLG